MLINVADTAKPTAEHAKNMKTILARVRRVCAQKQQNAM